MREGQGVRVEGSKRKANDLYFGVVRVKWVFLLRTARSSKKMGERPINIGSCKIKIKIKILNAPMNLLIDCGGGLLNIWFFFSLNLFPLCSHQVSKSFHEVVKFLMCSK
jgi:hypothetical protein